MRIRPQAWSGEPAQRSSIHVLALILLASLIGSYYVGRYGGLWAETDTATLTVAIREIVRSGTLTPEQGILYSNGYTYQAITAFIAHLTGLKVALLQQIFLPFAVILIALPAWMLYYEVSGSRSAATLGTLILFSQPEFLFVVLRGSHEKFGRLFMILALYALFRSLRFNMRPRYFVVYVLIFYLMFFGLISSNFLIGFSFISALTLAMVFGMACELLTLRNTRNVHPFVRRMQLLSLTCFVLAFVIMFYLYPPVQHTLLVMKGMGERLSALLLGTHEINNSYERVLQAWVNPWVYGVINAANWFILFSSFAIWVADGITYLRHRQRPASDHAWLLWLIYGAFGVQTAASILTDASAAASNLQHRIFPSLAIAGTMLVALWIGRVRLHHQVGTFQKVLAAAGASLLMLLSLVKASNEPLLVGWWVFYTQPEFQTLIWVDQHSKSTITWVGFNERLAEAYKLAYGKSSASNRFDDTFPPEPATVNFLTSDAIRNQALRVNRILPTNLLMLRIYDSGDVQIERRRPQTPYQR